MNCKDCRWVGEVRQGNSLQVSTVCRANPPTMQLMQVQSVGGPALQPITIWPIVNIEVDWCACYVEPHEAPF